MITVNISFEIPNKTINDIVNKAASVLNRTVTHGVSARYEQLEEGSPTERVFLEFTVETDKVNMELWSTIMSTLFTGCGRDRTRFEITTSGVFR